jgi:hypothetical protein
MMLDGCARSVDRDIDGKAQQNGGFSGSPVSKLLAVQRVNFVTVWLQIHGDKLKRNVLLFIGCRKKAFCTSFFAIKTNLYSASSLVFSCA